MALTPQIHAAFGSVLAAFGKATDAINAAFGGAGVAYNQEAQKIEVPQAHILAVVRGRVFDPKVRAWTCTLDGHDYYVLKLGMDGTLIYDVLAEQWYEWGSDDDPVWRAYYGNNWLGGRRFAETFGSNIIVGDDSNGSLYFLDPQGNFDDDAFSGAETPRPFLREIMGQIAMRGYDQKTCYSVSLMGAIGETADPTLTAITLFTSDDEGHSYEDQGTLNVDPGDYAARVDWNSGLGSFDAPGRLFLIQDRGALQRIDWLDMGTDED